MADVKARLEKRLVDLLFANDCGLVAQPVKSDDLAASSGSTDFGELFLAFSFFLIVSAALLVSLLFRLSIEQRAAEWGVLLAVGAGASLVRRAVLAEGLLLAVLGGILGLTGAIGYALGILWLLSRTWQAAVGTSVIQFHASYASYAIGFVGSVIVALIAIWSTVSRLAKSPAVELLSRGFQLTSKRIRERRRFVIGITVGGWIGGALVVAASLTGTIAASAAFFVGAALLLIGSLGGLSLALMPSERSMSQPQVSLARLVARNAGRHNSRSVATAGLIAFASFIVVSIGLLRHGPEERPARKESGDGGFALVAETSSPVFVDLGESDAKARDQLGLSAATEDLLNATKSFSLSLRPGDDTSCLNIYQPRNPTLLAVPASFRERGGFAFRASTAQTNADRANPWRLLEQRFEDGAIPAIGDANTLQWILKIGIGKDVVMTGDAGRSVRLRIVGSLEESIFQSELLISEERFREEFPDRAGRKYFLFEGPSAGVGQLRAALSKDFSRYGMMVETTGEKIAAFKAVENTYMQAFETLGGLGLVLGTIGLGTVLARNVIERRAELALLRALGFAKRLLARFVLAETFILLAAGLVVGTACAAIAVAPNLRRIEGIGPIASVLGLVGAVAATGLVSGFVAVRLALRLNILGALRSER